ncbi:MAG: hypothetical protein H0T72_10230 [Chloroflexia bacterium]|nr:hypothetical protein [Chloroflexia bacterium]
MKLTKEAEMYIRRSVIAAFAVGIIVAGAIGWFAVQISNSGTEESVTDDSIALARLTVAAEIATSVSFAPSFDDSTPIDPTDPYVDANNDIITAQQTIVAENPNDVENLLLLANLLGNSDHLDEPIPLYEKALQIAPEDVDARVSFARALADGDELERSEMEFLNALERDADSQQANYYLAELYLAWTPPRVQEAVTFYEQAAQIDPGTLIGERSAEQLEMLGTPEASPAPLSMVHASLFGSRSV